MKFYTQADWSATTIKIASTSWWQREGRVFPYWGAPCMAGAILLALVIVVWISR